MKFQACDYAAFLGYIAYAACALAIPTILPEIAESLHSPLSEGNGGMAGALHLWRSCAMMLTMLAAAFIVGRWGKRLSLGLALLTMGCGMLAAGYVNSYFSLVLVVAFSGLGQGGFEALVTPLVQEMHRADEPARYVNFTHSFWSAGTVGVMVLSGLALQYGVGWNRIPAAAGLLALLAGIAFLALHRKSRESAAETRPPAIVWKQVRHVLEKPRFSLFLACMMLAGGLEHCLLFWMPSYLLLEYRTSNIAAGIGTATFACGMLVGRIGSGIILRQNRTGFMLMGSAFGAFLFGLAPAFLPSLPLFYASLFVIGIFAGPLWPGIQSHCLNRMPEMDQTTMLILLPCVGIPGCGFFTWLMGACGDLFGFKNSIFIVPMCALLLAVLIGGELFWVKWLRNLSETPIAKISAPLKSWVLRPEKNEHP